MNDRERPRVVLLAGPDGSSAVVYNALTEVADVVEVIEERRVSRVTLAKRRRKRLGTWAVLDQILFVGLVQPVLARSSKARIAEIEAAFQMNSRPPPEHLVRRVPTINDASVVDALIARAPDVVVVNGTRIIGKTVLECIQAPFINTHVGITPAYRGVHGGYWALAEGKPELAGVTIHYVDRGIDTGDVIAQTTVDPTPADNFCTYPVLQLGAALPLLKQAVSDTFQRGKSTVPPRATTSRLYHHPGITRYLWHRLRHGVR